MQPEETPNNKNIDLEKIKENKPKKWTLDSMEEHKTKVNYGSYQSAVGRFPAMKTKSESTFEIELKLGW